MARKNACELCGLPDDSYTIEENGNIFHVCKLCHDGFVEARESGGDALSDISVDAGEIAASGGSKVETLPPDRMAKLLTTDNAERRKLYAALRKTAKSDKELLAADTEDLKRDMMEINKEIEAESDDALSMDKPAKEGGKTRSYSDMEARAKRNQKLDARRERARREANPTIDDERISITSPEVELEKDSRPKTNFDAATAEHVKSVRFYEAFRYVMHPVVYAVFAGLVVLAVSTAFMITLTWKEAVIDFFAGAGAVAVGFLLVWYLKRRFVTDKRTVLLRIRQEQIAFESMDTPCYRELKTKYPMIKALGWLLARLAVIVPIITIIGGTIAAVVLSFLQYWWLLAPVIAGATVGATLVYYMIKLCADCVSYKLDRERNQQIIEQTLLDLLSEK